MTWIGQTAGGPRALTGGQAARAPTATAALAHTRFAASRDGHAALVEVGAAGAAMGAKQAARQQPSSCATGRSGEESPEASWLHRMVVAAAM
jgi:hypothetical protein